MSQQPFTRLFGPIELATAGLSCWMCGKRTPVHAIQVADLEEFESDEEPDHLAVAIFVNTRCTGAGIRRTASTGVPRAGTMCATA